MKAILILLCAAGLQAQEGALRLGDEFFRNKAYLLSSEAYRAALFEGTLAPDKARFGLAKSYEKLGRFPEAEAAYRRFLDEHPSHPQTPEAMLGLGLSLQYSKDYEASQRVLKELLRDFPKDHAAPKAAFVSAENLFFMGRYQEAEEAYRGLRDSYPDFERPEYISYARAWCFFELGRTASRGGSAQVKKEAMEKAALLFAEAHDAAPGGDLAPYARYQEAESLFLLGRYSQAAEAYQDLQKRHDKHLLAPAARYSLGWCAFESKQWSDASREFHRFAVVHEGHALAPWALYLAGVSLARGGEADLAQSAYELVLKKYPGSEVEEKARFGLSWLATARKDWNAAVEAYTQFLKNFPEGELAPSALFLRADALYRQERYASAREDYLQLLKNFPRHALAEDALFFVAGCSLAQAEHKRALDELRQFRRERKDSPYYEEALLREADAHFGLGDLGASEKGYRELLAKKPKGMPQIQARSGLAWVAFSRKRYAEAYEGWKGLGQDYAGHDLAPEFHVHAGDSLFNAGRYADALLEYKKAEARPGPWEAEALYQSGWAHYRLRAFDLAYNAWAQASQRSLNAVRAAEAAYWMAWAQFRKGLYREAALSFDGVREKYPRSHLAPEALLRQGDSLYNAQAYEEAITVYKEVVRLYPGEAKAAAALHGIQWCYYSLGKDDEAIAASRDFLQKNRASEHAPEVQLRVAEHYLNRSDFKQAETELNTLKAAYPGSKLDLNATYLRGQARFKNLKFNEAITDWRELLQKNPSHPHAPKAAFKTGLAYYRLQEYPQALEAFQKVLDSYGNTKDVSADAQFNIGMTYKRMHKDEEAVKAYLLVVAGFPDSELAGMARIRIGYIHEDRGEYEKAIAAYRELASKDKGKLGAEAQYLVGDCLLALKKAGEAVLAYREVVDRFPGQPSWVVTALAKIGETEEAQGRDAKALAAYEEIVATGGDPSWVESAKKRIAALKAKLGQVEPAVKKPAKKGGKAKPKKKAGGKP